MKKIVFILSFILTNSLFANNIFEVKLNQNEKLEDTYTAEIENGSTIHFAVIKNSSTKKYSLNPFLVDANKKVIKLNEYTSNEVPNIISYHLNNEILTLVDYNKEKKEIHIIDYDLNSGKNKLVIQEFKGSPDNIFRLKNKSIIVSFDKKQLNIKTITNSSNQEQSQINIPKEKLKDFTSLKEGNPEAINQEEFVKNGSISKSKGYFINNSLIYTFEKSNAETGLFRFKIQNADDFEISFIKPNFSKETKEVSNYFYKDKILFLGIEKQDLKLKTFDLNTSKEISQLSFTNDLNQILSKTILNEYIKTALKSANKSTITVNQTKNNTLALNLENVKKDTYNYNYNWWFHFWFMQQNMMFLQQQQMMMRQMSISAPRGFGPSVKNYSEMFVSPKEEELASITLILDLDFKFTEDQNTETIFPKINKEKQLEKYKEDKTIKKFTSGFTNDEIRYIYQNQKTKSLIIAYEKLQ